MSLNADGSLIQVTITSAGCTASFWLFSKPLFFPLQAFEVWCVSIVNIKENSKLLVFHTNIFRARYFRASQSH